MTIFVKLPPNSGHLLITDKLFKTRRCPLFRGSTVTAYCCTHNIAKVILVGLNNLHYCLRVINSCVTSGSTSVRENLKPFDILYFDILTESCFYFHFANDFHNIDVLFIKLSDKAAVLFPDTKKIRLLVNDRPCDRKRPGFQVLLYYAYWVL